MIIHLEKFARSDSNGLSKALMSFETRKIGDVLSGPHQVIFITTRASVLNTIMPSHSRPFKELFASFFDGKSLYDVNIPSLLAASQL